MNAACERARFAKSLASRRQRPSQPNVREVLAQAGIQRLDSSTKPFCLSERGSCARRVADVGHAGDHRIVRPRRWDRNGSATGQAMTEAGLDAGGAGWRTEFEIAWGDCDHAGIVFYPHFFRWMDTAFHRLLAAKGTSHREVTERYGLVGLPIADAHAAFKSPVSYGDRLIVGVRVGQWARARFKVAYEGQRSDGSLVFTGHEVRAFAALDPATGRLKGRDIGEEFKGLFG
jgi:acyl-CoA thioesterase FadM